MKINLLALALAIPTFIFFSCKKDDLPVEVCESNQTESDTFMPLATGNFWVYEFCEVDTLDNKTCRTKFDTISVEGKEMVGGRAYFKIKGTGILNSIFPQYIRNEEGEILTPEYYDSVRLLTGEERYLFSQVEDTLEKTRCVHVNWMPNCSWRYTSYMVSGTSQLTVPAGTFDVVNSQELNIYTTPRVFYGNTQTNDRQFSKDVGLVRITAHFFPGTSILEFQLVDFSIN